MPSISKVSGYNVPLNTDEFSGGAGILDAGSLNAQKAFKDINDRLDLADETFDGLMSSADKTIVNSLKDLETQGIKGDIYVHNGTSFMRLPAGSDGQVLKADSSSPTGVAWANSTIG